MNDFRLSASHLCDELGLRGKTLRLWIDLIEQRIQSRWGDLAISTTPEAVTTPPVFVVHDRGDRDVLFEHALHITHTWPNVSMWLVHGVGHRKLLHNPEVVVGVTSFIIGLDLPTFQKWRMT